jgi:ubiquinol-cytochrome c reductase cytochrome b subunit
MGVIKKIFGWLEDRTGLLRAIKPLMEHKVPDTNWKTGWWYILGSLVLIAFILQVVTGIALSAAYVPSAGEAYASLQFITNQAPLGNFMRSMHAWGASAMILFIGMHALHAFIIGSYKYPREMNWLTGVILLLVTLAMAFTGQLLRWDQTAYWSVIVGADQAARAPIVGEQLARFILAGNTVGGATLSRFFAFHVFFIPAIVFIFIGFHLFLVIRNGVSEPPVIGEAVDPKTYREKYHELLEKKGVPFWPDAAWRDAVGAIALIIVMIVLSLVVGPPHLGAPPDPTILQAYPRPDWYFLWYFAVLALVPGSWEGTVIILGPLLVGVILIILPLVANKGERHPLRRPWAMAVVLLIVIMVGSLWLVGEEAPWSPAEKIENLPPEVVGANASATVQRGAVLYNEKGCQYCHIVGGYGGQRGPVLTSVGSRLSRQQIITRILNGGSGMPAYGTILQPDELNALVDFLETRKTPTDNRQGRRLENLRE